MRGKGVPLAHLEFEEGGREFFAHRRLERLGQVGLGRSFAHQLLNER